jgi:hypothetical protein
MPNPKRTEPQEDRQIKFFDALVESRGNVKQAAEVAEYTMQYGYELARKYKEYLVDRADGILHLHIIQAAATVVDTLKADGRDPAAKLKLDAAAQIMDRTGLSKQERMKVELSTPQGIFILPAKEIADVTESAEKE